LAAQERKDWEMAHQTEVERATLTEEEKQLLAYEAHPLVYQVGVFNQALVTTAASYLSRAAESIRKYNVPGQVGRYLEETLGRSEYAVVAMPATFVGNVLQVPGQFIAGLVDVPASVEYTIREAGEVTRIAKQHGAITTLTHVTGTRQLMEAVFGYDVITGEKVDRWAKTQEGLVRFSSTLMTLAGAMKAANVDATLIPRPPTPTPAAVPVGARKAVERRAAPSYTGEPQPSLYSHEYFSGLKKEGRLYPSESLAPARRVGETASTAAGKSIHKAIADARRASGEFDLVQAPITDKAGKPILVSKRVDLKTGKPQPGSPVETAIPDAVSFERRVIVDDKPLGRPIAKDRQEIIKYITAFKQREGHLPDVIRITRYDPKTGQQVLTELYSPEDFLP
jgi:hypothetical protein